jgi:hypothetical protein
MEWIRLDHVSQDGDLQAAKESLRQRMVEFLSGIPAWRARGIK